MDVDVRILLKADTNRRILEAGRHSRVEETTRYSRFQISKTISVFISWIEGKFHENSKGCGKVADYTVRASVVAATGSRMTFLFKITPHGSRGSSLRRQS